MTYILTQRKNISFKASQRSERLPGVSIYSCRIDMDIGTVVSTIYWGAAGRVGEVRCGWGERWEPGDKSQVHSET